MLEKVTQAVLPVAGWGTRFLPATKACPKAMLPILNKPLLQYAVTEAVEAGIKHLIFVTSDNQAAIASYFERSQALEAHLAEQGRQAELDTLASLLPEDVKCSYVKQAAPRGLGDAVLCAVPLLAEAPFAVLLPDDLLINHGAGCLADMIRLFQRQSSPAAVLACRKVTTAAMSAYGILDRDPVSGRVNALIEKPAPSETASRMAILGRYILPYRIFRLLATLAPGVGGEVQLTDAIAALLPAMPVFSYPFAGSYYDCGSPLGYLKASMDLALKDERYSKSIQDHMLDYTKGALMDA